MEAVDSVRGGITSHPLGSYFLLTQSNPYKVINTTGQCYFLYKVEKSEISRLCVCAVAERQ